MKNIGINTIYRKYLNNELFNSENCDIGQNLLCPNIELKKSLLAHGYMLQTIDKVNIEQSSYLLFQDIPNNTYKAIKNIKGKIKYILRNKKYDFLEKCIQKKMNDKMILIIMEPPSVNNLSYDINFHKYFNKILTWNDDLVDNIKYFKINYPQPLPEKNYDRIFKEKKFCTLICSNKGSLHPNELYSQRLNVINYFENNNCNFQFYGVGWKQNYKNYKGYIKDKLETLSQYKFCFCYENITEINGYITEKIFDSFFAKCIPIYWGANNILEYIPSGTFIDRRKFANLDSLVQYISNMNEQEYMSYINNIKHYLLSKSFKKNFSVDSYIQTIENVVLNEKV